MYAIIVLLVNLELPGPFGSPVSEEEMNKSTSPKASRLTNLNTSNVTCKGCEGIVIIYVYIIFM